MRLAEKIRDRGYIKRCAGVLALVVFAFVSVCPAQSARPRPASSLTSEDLLDRRVVVYAPAPGATEIAPSRAQASTAASTFYRDPLGAFTLNFPNRNWQPNAKAGRGKEGFSHRSFRKVEAEGFTSARATVFVLSNPVNLHVGDVSRLSLEQQKALALVLAGRFLSNNVSLVSVEVKASPRGTGLHIIADQMIARRAVVRASINAFERQGQLFVVVCCAPVETFDHTAPDFEAITESLAVSVTRSS